MSTPSAQDHVDLSRLITSVVRSIDSSDWDRLIGLFAADGVVEPTAGHGGEPVPVAEFAASLTQLKQVLGARYMQHFMPNPDISVDGDRATVFCDSFGFGILDHDEPGNVVLAGVAYDFEMRRTASGWRIARMKETTIFNVMLHDVPIEQIMAGIMQRAARA